MTLISLHTPAVARAATRRAAPPRLHLTLRGRRILAAVVLAPIALAVGIGVGIGLAQVPAAFAGNESNANVQTFETHTVLSGETLWGIASEIAGERDVRDVMLDIQHLNLLDSTALQAGQELALPAP